MQLVLDGNELPSMMLPTGLRTATQNQVKVTFGGQLMVDALVRVDEPRTRSTSTTSTAVARPRGRCNWASFSGLARRPVSSWPRPDTPVRPTLRAQPAARARLAGGGRRQTRDVESVHQPAVLVIVSQGMRRDSGTGLLRRPNKSASMSKATDLTFTTDPGKPKGGGTVWTLSM